MAFSVDANLLLHAVDSDNPFHQGSRDFLQSIAEGSEVLCLGWTTVLAFLRISTHPRIFSSPLKAKEAEANVDALLGLPHVRLLSETEDFWKTYRRVTREHPPRGNAVPDTHLAALLLHHGIRRLYTRDSDFRRFDFLESIDPLG